MKTIAKTMFAFLILANLSISCKKESQIPTTETSSMSSENSSDTIVDGANADSPAATTATNVTDDKQATSQQNGTSAKQPTAAGASNKTPKDKKESGMSAPDGTDAENHDGDMYTKNDNTKMPSGTPIK